MYENISIKLMPYLGRSKNLMEFFVIIGYEEKILLEKSKFFNIEKDGVEILEISVISSVISDLAYGVFDPDKIIKQIYPDKPTIIKITKNDQPPPKRSSVLFYSCFDSLVGNNKILYSCYALRFHEKFTTSKGSYYIPKAILIFSQYPYFTTFHNICLNTLAQINENKKDDNIPIEILIHCLVNYIPSPINTNLKLKLFSNKNEIFIEKLSGYPYIDFDLGRIFNLININEFIKIYMMTFLEISLLFFSPDLLKLNIFMYILNILNYPLIDSNYYWHIKSISKDEVKFGEDTLNPTFRGVNSNFSPDFDFSNYRNLNFIVDIENKKIKPIEKNKEDENEKSEKKEILYLLKYVENILNGKKVNSYFLHKYLISLKEKLTKIKKDYDKKVKNAEGSFLYVNSTIIDINKQIQEAFYDFILNILIILYKDYQLDSKCNEITKNPYKNSDISEEENIFLKNYRNTIKYNTYFDLFICQFKSVDELKVSLLFSDEYVNVKMRDNKKQISEKINYFQLIEKFYSLKTENKTIDSNDLKEEFKKNYKARTIKSYIRETENQLFDLDKNIIKIFLFHKKSRGLFESLRIKEKEEIKIDTKLKTSIGLTLENYFYPICDREFFSRSSCIYIFSMIFPLFSHKKIISFLHEMLNNNLSKIKFFQRNNIYIILKSIHKYYLVNQELAQFPDLTFENIKEYCTTIKQYLIANSIVPNEEIFLFLKKVLAEGKLDIKTNEKNKNIFVFKYEKEEKYENNINEYVVRRDKMKKNTLIFKYKEIKKSCELYDGPPMLYQLIYSYFDNYFTKLNFNIINFGSENIIDIIINLIHYLYGINETFLCVYLLNAIILLKKLQKDLTVYKMNNINNENNINNINENLIINSDNNENDNNNDDNIIINDNENDNEIINK